MYLGRQGHLAFKRAAGKYEIAQGTDVSDNKVPYATTEMFVTGEKVRLFNPDGLFIDVNGDGYSDSPDGHGFYAGSTLAVIRNVSEPTFYNGLDGDYFYANSITHTLTSELTVYVNVSAAGTLRFYNSFKGATCKLTNSQYALFDEYWGKTYIHAVDEFAPLFQIESWQLNLDRTAVDISALGETFKENHGSQISGSGSIDGFWSNIPNNEYLYRLLLKASTGTSGVLKLYINTPSESTLNDPYMEVDDAHSIWYESEVVINQIGISVEKESIVTASISFVCTGEIELKIGEESVNDFVCRC